MNRYKFELDQLRCKFNPDDTHFYAEARILPCCSKLACLECILNDYSNGYLKCTYCAKINKLFNINELKPNQLISDEIISRSAELLNEIEAKFKLDANQSKGNFFWINSNQKRVSKILFFLLSLIKKKKN